jgi:hypothetical protein
MSVAFHEADPPAGFVDVITSPFPSTTTHKAADEHDTAVRFRVIRVPTMARAQSASPPVGLFDVTTLPFSSTTMQKFTVGHDTSVVAFQVNGGSWSILTGVDHVN